MLKSKEKCDEFKQVYYIKSRVAEECSSYRLEKLKSMNLEALEEMTKRLLHFLNSKGGEKLDDEGGEINVDDALKSI